MTCDSGGLTGEIEMRPQEALAAVADLDVLRRPLHLDAERTVPSHGVTLLGAVVPRHVPPQLGAVVLLRRRADVGSGEETRGAETVRSLRKDALGRPCNCNTSQQVPTRLLRLASGLHGPVECAGLLLHLDRGHGITASLPDVLGELPRELHYVAADFALGDGRPLLALQTAPVSTRVLSKWPKDTSPEDLSYLREMPMRLLHLASGPHVPVECGRLLLHLERGHGITASLLDPTGELTKELHYVAGDCTLGDGRSLLALQIAPVSTRVHIKRPMETSVEDLLCYLHFGDLNMIETRGENVNEIYAIERTTPICFLIHTPGTQEQSYIGPDASAGVVSCNFATHAAKIKRQCVVKQGSLLDTWGQLSKEPCYMVADFTLSDVRLLFSLKIAPVMSTRVQIKWPMDTLVGDLLTYLHDPKATSFQADKTIATGKVYYEDVSTKYSSTHYPSERVALLCKIQLSHRFVVTSWGKHSPGWRSLSRLLKVAKERELHYVAADITLGDGRPRLAHQIAPVRTSDHIKWPMETSVDDLLCYLHDPKAASLLVDKTTCSKKMDYSYMPCFHNQQTNECKMSNIDSKHDGDSKNNDGLLIPIFVRHVSGELTLTINLNQSSQQLMHLYAQKTKTKLECQYFVYGTKILEPHGSLLFYGVERDTTVHVCTRLLGGMVTINEYILSKKKKLLAEVTLPDGRVSLVMTKEGCLFLSTWLKCFTRAFADSKSWEGDFDLDDFRVINDHVVVIKSAERRLISSSMHADLTRLIGHIKKIFHRKKSNLVSEFPPYLENLTSFLKTLKSPILTDSDKLFIETHICCVESTARGILLVMLRRKQKSFAKSVQQAWDRAMARPGQHVVDYANAYSLNQTAVFDDIIAHGNNHNEPYTDSRPSTFRLMRDEYMHAPANRFDKSSKTWKEKFKNDDGIELMIPANNPNFIPDIIYRWIISDKVDIEQELLAAQVRCTCHFCYPPHLGNKDGGESSTAGKGKQAESSGSSQPSTPSSRQGSYLGAGRPPYHQSQAAASSGFSQPSTTSSRQGSNLGSVRPPRQQSHAAASLGFSQPSTTSSRQGSNLGSVRPPPWQQSHAGTSSGFSQPSTPSSRQGSYLGAVRPPPWQQSHAGTSSGFSRPSMPSWQGSYLGAGRPPWLQSQAAARSGFSQPAAPRPRPPPPAPTQQQSSSSDSELGWQTATRRGKGKRYD